MALLLKEEILSPKICFSYVSLNDDSDFPLLFTKYNLVPEKFLTIISSCDKNGYGIHNCSKELF